MKPDWCSGPSHSTAVLIGEKDEGRQIDQLKEREKSVVASSKKNLFLTHGERHESLHVLPSLSWIRYSPSLFFHLSIKERDRKERSHKSRKSRSQPPRSHSVSRRCGHISISPPFSLFLFVCTACSLRCIVGRCSTVCRRPVILYQSRAGQSRVWLYITTQH